MASLNRHTRQREACVNDSPFEASQVCAIVCFFEIGGQPMFVCVCVCVCARARVCVWCTWYRVFFISIARANRLTDEQT